MRRRRLSRLAQHQLPRSTWRASAAAPARCSSPELQRRRRSALGGITANFNEWASGFTCIKGVDIAPVIVNGASPLSARWTELIN
jgi:hypothetical protein